MTVDAWLRAAIADAEERGLPELKPMLESLALATSELRGASLTPDAGGAPLDRIPVSAGAEDVAAATQPAGGPPR